MSGNGRLSKALPGLLGACCLLFGIGCESALETGYKPRPLNASETDRRAYYAPAFTPESQRQESGGPAPGAGFRRPGS